MSDVEFGIVIMCDDVRKEINNKDILIGVYVADIILSQLPVMATFSYWIEVIPKKSGTLNINLRIQPPGKIPPFELNVEAQVDEKLSKFAILTGQVGHPISEAGTIQLLAKSAKFPKWKPILTKRIIYQAPSFSPTSSVPPPL